MKKALSILGFCILFLVYDSSACSVSVNDLAQKNELAAQAASHLDLSFTSISGTSFSDYQRSFSGAGGSQCPKFFHSSAVIQFQYALSSEESCDAQVTVKRIENLKDGQIQVAFEDMSAACSVRAQREQRSARVKRPRRP
jgi:hypothetical protein